MYTFVLSIQNLVEMLQICVFGIIGKPDKALFISFFRYSSLCASLLVPYESFSFCFEKKQSFFQFEIEKLCNIHKNTYSFLHNQMSLKVSNNSILLALVLNKEKWGLFIVIQNCKQR